MGMFDYVNFEMQCPNCGKLMNKFQSKDSDCVLETIEIDDIYNFYDICDNCKLWVEFTKERPAKTEKRKNRASLKDAVRLNFKQSTKQIKKF